MRLYGKFCFFCVCCIGNLTVLKQDCHMRVSVLKYAVFNFAQ